MFLSGRIGQKIFARILVLCGRMDEVKIPPNILITNWIFQRLLGINRKVPISVHYTSRIQGYKYMTIGKTARYSMAVSACSNIVAVEGTTLEIGESTIFAQNVCIRTCNHQLLDRSNYDLASVKIGNNCWLGHGVVILPGISLGDNITVGANSVVTKSFPDNVVLAGVPAVIIKSLNSDPDK